MSSLGRVGLSKGQAARDSQGSDDNLSKVVELNGSYRIYIRTFQDEEGDWDLMSIAIPGRSADPKICGTSFIVYDSTQVEEDPETGKLRDNTGLSNWMTIGNIIHEASCSREKKNAEAEAKRSAEELGEDIDKAELEKTLRDIDAKYHGTEVNGKQVPPDISRPLSPLQWKILTQGMVVKLDAKGVPDFKNAKPAIIEISKSRANEIRAVLNNKDYYTAGEEFVEFGYAYQGADKKAAGQAASFSGIADSIKLAKVYPELWEQGGKAKINSLVKGKDAEETAKRIQARSRSLSYRTSPDSVVASMRKWFATNKAVAGSFNYEDEQVQRGAQVMLDSGLLDNLPKVKAEFERLALEQKKKRGEVDENGNPIGQEPGTVDQTEAHEQSVMANIGGQVEGNASLSQIMDGVGDLDLIAELSSES